MKRFKAKKGTSSRLDDDIKETFWLKGNVLKVIEMDTTHHALVIVYLF
jgi:hypothetical protein